MAEETMQLQTNEADEEAWETNAVIRQKIHESRIAYQMGDYVTIDEYVQSQAQLRKDAYSE